MYRAALGDVGEGEVLALVGQGLGVGVVGVGVGVGARVVKLRHRPLCNRPGGPEAQGQWIKGAPKSNTRRAR